MIGVIDLECSHPAAFSESDQQLLVSLADRAAVAIENAQLFDMVVNEQRKTKLVLQSIADGVYTVDRDLRITAFNPAAERITGWTEDHPGVWRVQCRSAVEPEQRADCIRRLATVPITTSVLRSWA